MISIGIFDVIGPVMIGPSSSHTAGAVQLGKFARTMLIGEPLTATIGLHGSLSSTGEGHGTHLAILAGIMGFNSDDERIPRAKEIAREHNLEYTFSSIDLGDVHPNSARINLSNPADSVTVFGSSIGGAKIAIWKIEHYQVDLNGEYPALLLFYPDHPGVVAAVTLVLAKHQLNIARMKVSRSNRGGEALMNIELDQKPTPEILAELQAFHDIRDVRYIPNLQGEN